jgi:prevent-host-death family protein
MKKAKIADLKNNLSRYLEHVRAGGTVVVLDRARPIARIVPLDRGRGTANDGQLAVLEREGVIRRGTGRLPAWFGRGRPRRGASGVLATLLEERRSGW